MFCFGPLFPDGPVGGIPFALDRKSRPMSRRSFLAAGSQLVMQIFVLLNNRRN
jgi:hypothetical protein